jgi:hypothetical protein
MTDCIIKAFGGCACKPGECAERPATVAPTVQASVKTIMLTALTLGVVFTWFGFVALSRADEHFRKAALDQQEVTRHDPR